MQFQMRRYGSVAPAAGADSVLWSWPLPKECVLNQLQGEVHMIPGGDLTVTDVVMYGCEGWIVQSEAAADFQSQDTLWDTGVPKDDSSSDVLDTTFTTNTISMMEAGEINVAQLFDQELLGPERFFQREKMLSYANAPSGFKDATPDTCIPADTFPVNVGKRYLSRRQSGVLVGIGSPDFAATNDNDVIPQLGALGTAQSMYAMRFMENYLDSAMVALITLVEAGAETPYDEILDFVQSLLEKMNSGGGGSGRFDPVTWTASGVATAGIMVPGRVRHSTIGPDSQA